MARTSHSNVCESRKQPRKLQAVLYREALLWEDLKHPYVLPFLGMDSETFPSYLPCIVTPWMQHGTVLDHIQNNVSLNGGLDPLIHLGNCSSPSLSAFTSCHSWGSS